MILKPYSIEDQFGNTTLLQSTDFETSFPRASADLQMQTNASYVKRAGAVPVYSGKDYLPVVKQLEVICKHDFMTLFETLNQIFDTKDETPRRFICQDLEDASAENPKQYYIYVTAKQVLGGHEGNMATIALAVDDPIWQSVTQNSQTWSIASSTSSTDVTVGGNDFAWPVFEITPVTASSTDYIYHTPLQIIPTSSNPWNNRFLDLTGSTDGTFDTAALVAAGKMQADGDDLRVFRDGVEVDRWLDGMNTTDTHVIVSCNMLPQYRTTLKTAFASTDTVSEIEINNTTANRNALSAMPAMGRVVVCASLGSTDSEELTYTAKILTDTKLALTINARAVRNTSAFSHAANAYIYHEPYDFTLAYGNASATAPVTDDTRKPLPALTSRNWSFVFSLFNDSAGLRPHSWYKTGKVPDPNKTNCRSYTSTDDGGDTDPASAIGLMAATFKRFGVWVEDDLFSYWNASFPDGIASISVSGAQNQTTANIPTIELDAVNTNGNVSQLFALAAQASTDYGTWKEWSKATTDITIPAGTVGLQWKMVGWISGNGYYSSKAEIDAMTVGLSNYPDVRIRAEMTGAKIDCTIGNATTGESFRVEYYIPVSTDTLYIDTDPSFPTAKHNGQIINGVVKLSSIRPAWLKLRPSSNTLTFENNLAASNELTIAVKWRDRANFF